MKLLIAGSRNIHLTTDELAGYIVDKDITDISEIVSGGASGVDTSARNLATKYGIKFTEFPADWNKHGKAAGPIRNREMALYADALLLIWDGQSKGSKNMLDTAFKLALPFCEIIIPAPPYPLPYQPSKGL